MLVDLFPVVADYEVTHSGEAPLPCRATGMRRWEWTARGFALGGGSVGDGVTTTNHAGRTLAQLITGQESELTRLPRVEHHSRPWEPEPLRWLGVNAGRLLMASADRVVARTGRPARRARTFSHFIGY